jgi:diazepam-binding inhibitor (GABA receptor modulating acyl-CoA-binding protein)
MNDTFEKAAEMAQNLSQRPTNEELLKLYALYKQGTEGDVTGDRPGGFDFKGAAKYDAWSELKGLGNEEAREAYIAFVASLQEKYNS